MANIVQTTHPNKKIEEEREDRQAARTNKSVAKTKINKRARTILYINQ